MKQRCNPPRLDDFDWGQLDFTRWNLDGVAQNTVAKAIAGLTQQFFESPEWQENVQASMPQLQQLAVGVYKDHAGKLREKRVAAERDYEQLAASAKSRVEDVRRAMTASASPRLPEPDKDAYHLAVRVTGADPLLGFPGLLVEVADPRNENAAPVVAGHTDADGNVTLTVGAELAREIDKRDTTITVSLPAGKVVARIPNGVCVRLNQVETKVITLKESAEMAPLKQAALDTRQGREVLLASTEARLQSLAKDREERLANLDCAVHEADNIVADLEKPPDLAEILKRAMARAPSNTSGSAPAGAAPSGAAPAAPPAASPPAATPAGTRPGTVAAPAPSPVRTTTIKAAATKAKATKSKPSTKSKKK